MLEFYSPCWVDSLSQYSLIAANNTKIHKSNPRNRNPTAGQHWQKSQLHRSLDNRWISVKTFTANETATWSCSKVLSTSNSLPITFHSRAFTPLDRTRVPLKRESTSFGWPKKYEVTITNGHVRLTFLFLYSATRRSSVVLTFVLVPLQSFAVDTTNTGNAPDR